MFQAGFRRNDFAVNRPLETTFWMRFKQFLKGVFLYNTIYWRRASDDLDIKRMSREERASLRPKRDLEIIRPRENPRPVNASVLNLPPEAAERPFMPTPEMREPAQSMSVEPPSADAAVQVEEGVEIHRRKKRRRSRHSKVIPKKYLESNSGGGMLGWLFKK